MTIIDRLGDDVAVLEMDNEELVEVPRDKLPERACEGDVLVNSGSSWLVDTEATAKRRAAIKSRIKRLLSRND